MNTLVTPLTDEQMEMMGRLSGMTYLDGIYYSTSGDDALLLLTSKTERGINSGTISKIRSTIVPIIGTVTVKGVLTNSTIKLFNSLSCKVLDLTQLDTSKTTVMERLFISCEDLEQIKFSELFQTSQVTTMAKMFAYCGSLEEIDLSYFRTENVEYMHNMFTNCRSLKSLDLSTFSTVKVIEAYNMFGNCYDLEHINFGNFHAEHVTNFFGLFENCKKLKHIDLSSFADKKGRNMCSMFSGCRSLESLDLSHFTFHGVSNISRICNDCISLKTLDLSNLRSLKIALLSRIEPFAGVSHDIEIIIRTKRLGRLLRDANLVPRAAKIYANDVQKYI